MFSKSWFVVVVMLISIIFCSAHSFRSSSFVHFTRRHTLQHFFLFAPSAAVAAFGFSLVSGFVFWAAAAANTTTPI